jgi:hypothetical protein
MIAKLSTHLVSTAYPQSGLTHEKDPVSGAFSYSGGQF